VSAAEKLAPVKERPILFSAPMVRALLEGRKTQTRRPVKAKHAADVDAWHFDGGSWRMGVHGEGGPTADMGGIACPYGQPGDRLWVRETFVFRSKHERFYYRADHPVYDPYAHYGWLPSIFMPRKASRITLEVTEVRVERLHDISEGDAKAEGARRFDDLPDPHPYGIGARWSMAEPANTEHCLGTARMAFANLWESINGSGSWALNPWVWVISFRRVTP